ncbi:putative pre-16S rRNA nuclease [Zafaria cholistanensis]|uniref:Putative pre-16S rRNA nuclease n=1 Tax=Zafaria cholistanensis TaxID=1682741 RepID=A0A5A7NMK1_9MICC|nr:putative pre-16S rRNA nuclease [Zafaria cholistanensis]
MGLARVGVAACDPDGMLATPLKTLRRDEKKGSDLRALAFLAAERDAVQVFVGLPRSLGGGDTESTRMARAYAEALAVELRTAGSGAAVRLIDERLTTVSAHRALREAGLDGRRHRQVVDQVAAADILQQALDMQKSLQRDVGIPVDDGLRPHDGR